jgi:hypothetical protein
MSTRERARVSHPTENIAVERRKHEDVLGELERVGPELLALLGRDLLDLLLAFSAAASKTKARPVTTSESPSRSVPHRCPFASNGTDAVNLRE